MALVAAVGVVVLDVGAQYVLKMTLAGMSSRSVHSRRSDLIQRSANAFIRGACGAVRTMWMPIEVKTRVECCGELGVAVVDQVGETLAGVDKIGCVVAGQLGCPSSG
ncbi:hypothetical protein [Actinokineospora sp. NBRC 105648]|uniref:hypothetical protein n=1 Tax=Actinokineospora sp. NBRC 105648 TaxID=3032206 RepID=UPI0024A12625|nr:hypothetical protein [Actinokineospora sp. NBRC 105648]GLZ43622.1 hypothetical protein Acsp05_72460 [Actinokineospora sp. NBRC 105648]